MVSVCVNLVIFSGEAALDEAALDEAALDEAGEVLLLLLSYSDVSFSSSWITSFGVGGSGSGRGARTGDCFC